MTFLNFFEEASHVFLPDGRPPYIYGDHIIMDNAAIHHNRAGDAPGRCGFSAAKVINVVRAVIA